MEAMIGVLSASIVDETGRNRLKLTSMPSAANFTLAETVLRPLQDQEVLVRNLFMSVEPYMRGRMNDAKSY